MRAIILTSDDTVRTDGYQHKMHEFPSYTIKEKKEISHYLGPAYDNFPFFFVCLASKIEKKKDYKEKKQKNTALLQLFFAKKGSKKHLIFEQ